MSEQIIGKKLSDFLKSNDAGILKVPQKIFNPYRILILKILYLHGYADFRELKHDLQISDGNLASHLRTLENEGYINVFKQIVDRKPRTAYELTRDGMKAFEQFRIHVERVIKNDIQK